MLKEIKRNLKKWVKKRSEGFRSTGWNNNKNNEMFWAVLSSLERYKIPEGENENEFRGKAGGANQKKQKLRNDCSRISATQRLDTGGVGMESRGHKGTYRSH